MTRHDLDHRHGAARWTEPEFQAAALCLLALILAALPASTSQKLSATTQQLLAPGQRGALSALAWGRLQWHGASSTSREQAADYQRLRSENRALRAEAASLRLALSQVAPASDAPPLLRADTVVARVLGTQTRAHLAAAVLLDAGAQQRILQDALALVQTADASQREILVDQPASHEHASGQLALAGRVVWGQVVASGNWTSRVRPVRDPLYRAVVHLADPRQGTPRPAAQGLWEGTGAAEVRLRHIPVTQWVAVGDAVLASGWEGLTDAPLLYGFVSRAQRPAGGASWEIHVQPAADEHFPPQLEILRGQLNPGRLLAGNEAVENPPTTAQAPRPSESRQ